MTDLAKVLKANILKVSYTSNYKYLTLMDSETENAAIFEVGTELKCLKVLKGAGTFLTNDCILLFYNDSGYGYLNTDGYLYQISSNKIIPLFPEKVEAVQTEVTHRDSPEGFFVSVLSGI